MLFDHAFVPAFYHEYISIALYHSGLFISINTSLRLDFSFTFAIRLRSGDELAFLPKKDRRCPKRVALTLLIFEVVLLLLLLFMPYLMLGPIQLLIFSSYLFSSTHLIPHET